MPHNPYVDVMTQREEPEGWLRISPGSMAPTRPRSTNVGPDLAAQEQAVFNAQKASLGSERALTEMSQREASRGLEDIIGMSPRGLSEPILMELIKGGMARQKHQAQRAEASAEWAHRQGQARELEDYKFQRGQQVEEAKNLRELQERHSDPRVQLAEQQLTNAQRSQRVQSTLLQMDPGFYNRPVEEQQALLNAATQYELRNEQNTRWGLPTAPWWLTGTQVQQGIPGVGAFPGTQPPTAPPPNPQGAAQQHIQNLKTGGQPSGQQQGRPTVRRIG